MLQQRFILFLFIIIGGFSLTSLANTPTGNTPYHPSPKEQKYILWAEKATKISSQVIIGMAFFIAWQQLLAMDGSFSFPLTPLFLGAVCGIVLQLIWQYELLKSPYDIRTDYSFKLFLEQNKSYINQVNSNIPVYFFPIGLLLLINPLVSYLSPIATVSSQPHEDKLRECYLTFIGTYLPYTLGLVGFVWGCAFTYTWIQRRFVSSFDDVSHQKIQQLLLRPFATTVGYPTYMKRRLELFGAFLLGMWVAGMVYCYQSHIILNQKDTLGLFSLSLLVSIIGFILSLLNCNLFSYGSVSAPESRRKDFDQLIETPLYTHNMYIMTYMATTAISAAGSYLLLSSHSSLVSSLLSVGFIVGILFYSDLTGTLLLSQLNEKSNLE